MTREEKFPGCGGKVVLHQNTNALSKQTQSNTNGMVKHRLLSCGGNLYCLGEDCLPQHLHQTKRVCQTNPEQFWQITNVTLKYMKISILSSTLKLATKNKSTRRWIFGAAPTHDRKCGTLGENVPQTGIRMRQTSNSDKMIGSPQWNYKTSRNILIGSCQWNYNKPSRKIVIGSCQWCYNKPSRKILIGTRHLNYKPSRKNSDR